MDEFLEVDASLAQGADDNVGADAAVVGNVASGVLEADVRGVVSGGDPDPGTGGGDDVLGGGWGGEPAEGGETKDGGEDP